MHTRKREVLQLRAEITELRALVDRMMVALAVAGHAHRNPPVRRQR